MQSREFMDDAWIVPGEPLNFLLHIKYGTSSLLINHRLILLIKKIEIEFLQFPSIELIGIKNLRVIAILSRDRLDPGYFTLDKT